MNPDDIIDALELAHHIARATSYQNKHTVPKLGQMVEKDTNGGDRYTSPIGSRHDFRVPGSDYHSAD